MNLALGVFDVFAYSVPGALYLGLIVYVLDRASWVQVSAYAGVNSTLLVIGAILASYLLGHITYLPRRFLERHLPGRLRGTGSARRQFLDRVPPAAGLGYVQADSALVLAAIELKARESATEIGRLRATGIALRNAAFALVLAAVAAVVEIVTGPQRGFAAVCAALFLGGALASLRAGFMHSRWAVLKTLEVGFWLPDIEAAFRPPSPGGPNP